MSVFSYHLVETSYVRAFQMLVSSCIPKSTKGLIHSETMSYMVLGSKVYSPSRIFSRNIIVFAQWENENALEEFLNTSKKGAILNKNWYLRLKFLRQWGSIEGFQIPEKTIALENDYKPVVAITIARMRLLEIPRFIRWGRPVEKLVRDHPGTTISLASIRLPRTVSTFSIWNSQKEMTDMSHGHSNVEQPRRHVNAMKERNRKDFHLQFTTLRFKAISEHGQWKGKCNYVPSLKDSSWE